MNSYFIGIFIVLIGIVTSRIITERGVRHLSTEEKGRVVETFSSFRIWNLLPLILVLGAYVFMRSDITQSTSLYNGLLVLLFIIALLSKLYIARRLRALDLPQSYLRMQMIGQMVSLGALVVFFVLILR